jgi:hypothetical protein
MHKLLNQLDRKSKLDAYRKKEIKNERKKERKKEKKERKKKERKKERKKLITKQKIERKK